MPLSISTEQQQLFDRSLETIEKVEALFVEAKELFPEFAPDIKAFKQQLANPFSIFICGEFNTGKSSLLNQLNNEEIASVGFLPTTKCIESYNPEGLGGLVFIDSPGINSIIEQHQELTESYLQQADIILFVTSIERPLSRSEQEFLAIVDRTWDRKIIVVINKIDLIEEQQVGEVINFVNEGLTEILSEMPPVFAISALTGTGMDQFKNFLLAFLAESEKVKLKLRGPQSSLLVYLNKLRQKNLELQNKLQTEKTLFDRTSKRIEERLEEYNLLFGIFRDNIDDLFTALIQGVSQLIDSNTSFFTVIKRKFTKEEDLLEERLAKTIKEIQLDKNLQEIFKEATSTFLKYRERIVREAKEDLETAITIAEDSFKIPTVSAESLDVEQLATRIKAAAEIGLDRFWKLGVTAAATGVGGQLIFSAATIDATAFAIAGFFGLLSFNAIPQERNKAKQELETNFRTLQENYTNTLKETLATELNKCLQKFADVIRPKQEELDSQINLTKSIQEREETIRSEIQSILEDVEKI
ncbi:dynamin family protein [Myxosarcina sp. GI1(2024)]